MYKLLLYCQISSSVMTASKSRTNFQMSPPYLYTTYMNLFLLMNINTVSFHKLTLPYTNHDILTLTRLSFLFLLYVPLPPSPSPSFPLSLSPSTPTSELPGLQFATLLTAIRDSEQWLDRTLADFRADVQQTQDEAATKVVNCIRHDKPYQFKKNAHEEQLLASTSRCRKASKRHRTPLLPSRTHRHSCVPKRLWKKVRGSWPRYKS